MSYIDDLKADYACTPGVVAVTYTTPGGTATPNVQANVDPAGPSYREVQSGAAGMEPADIVWILWAATVGTPLRGGTITESVGTAWVILSLAPVREEGVILKWRCMCRQHG